MKNKNVLIRTMGFVSAASLLYCLYAYIRLQAVLKVGAQPPQSAEIMGILIMPALALVGIYHILMLLHALKNASGRFFDSVFIAAAALSGITLMSDVTFLSDIGKEYALFDVTGEWSILYGFTALHVLVTAWGLLRMKEDRKQMSGIKDERFFLTMNHIGLLSGLLGIGLLAAISTGRIVPPRFVSPLVILLSALSLFPLVLFAVYWIGKLRHTAPGEWLDEKQFTDTAIGALAAIAVSVPAYILICVLDILHIAMPLLPLVLLLFFLQLGTLSTTLIIRNR